MQLPSWSSNSISETSLMLNDLLYSLIKSLAASPLGRLLIGLHFFPLPQLFIFFLLTTVLDYLSSDLTFRCLAQVI